MIGTGEGCLCGINVTIAIQSIHTQDMSRPPRARRISVFERTSRFPFQKAAMPKIAARIAVPKIENAHNKAIDELGLKYLMHNGQEKKRMKKTRLRQNDSLAKIRGWNLE
jgi:hypothetical protein